MPTSAATGTTQVSTAGAKKTKATKATDTSDLASVPTPDGAPVKTDPDDVQPGDRVDFAPSPPQDHYTGTPALNGDGVVQEFRRDGSAYLVQKD